MRSDGSLKSGDDNGARLRYAAAMQGIEAQFRTHPHGLDSGRVAVGARAGAVDDLLRGLWEESALVCPGAALIAVGGYGRSELFPFSDVDLMFMLEGGAGEQRAAEKIREVSQRAWDSGLRLAPMTRSLEECRLYDARDAEFTLALLDARYVAGDPQLASRLVDEVVPAVVRLYGPECVVRLAEMTQGRHRRYGHTLFHLEPNVKEHPGGLRDAHVCGWIKRLSGKGDSRLNTEFEEARNFLLLLRTFLHLEHGRDDNTLDWAAQDNAAKQGLGTEHTGADAAMWMRGYFRHARAIERNLSHALLEPGVRSGDSGGTMSSALRRKIFSDAAAPAAMQVDVRGGQVLLADGDAARKGDAARDPDTVFAIFAAMAHTGARLSRATELRLEAAMPALSESIEDGHGLSLQLRAILLGRYAGRALRAMHALGVLELVIPEFHGIDALVIRDAYHRYTVDEHTFVLIDTLHGLAALPAEQDAWAARFAGVLRDLPHPELLYLAALLHDTGKGHAGLGHAGESARMAASVLKRLEIDGYEAELILGVVRNHLEMSAALRRDVFDAETVRAFADRVPTPEALRMLTLFTYADIMAVHPDALSPWKAENLWRLYLATAGFLDRNVDEERVGPDSERETQHRVQALLPGREREVAEFLDGLPRRYLLTRSPEQIRSHIDMASRVRREGSDQIELRYAPELSEVTLITRDRPKLFAGMAGALAGWGMNIVTADAFANAHGFVVDSFRFTDPYRTLELNREEQTRFVATIGDIVAARGSADAMLEARRRAPRSAAKVNVASRIDFEEMASTHSTLLQVVAQDSAGLLRALALTLAEEGCNIEVALVDTEGEMAIDVFYLTVGGAKLKAEQRDLLRERLLAAIATNARW